MALYHSKGNNYAAKSAGYAAKSAGYAAKGVAGTYIAKGGALGSWPLSAADLVTALGYGDAGNVRHIYGMSDPSSPLADAIGGIHLAGSGTAATFQVATGLPPANDLAIELANGATTQYTAPSAAVPEPGANPFVLILEFQLQATSGGTRMLFGTDGATRDWNIGVDIANRPFLLTNDGTTVRTSTILSSHFDGAYHTLVAACVPGANQRIASDLALSAALSTAAMGDLTDATGSMSVGRTSANAPVRITYAALLLSDGGFAQNLGITNIYDNLAAAVSNLRAYTGR
jgi:hypothetical protein